MEKQKILIIQILDDNYLKRNIENKEVQNTLVLCKNLKSWCDYHNYDHHVHYLSDDYKKSDEFKHFMYNEHTKIHISNIAGNNHSKMYGFIKCLESLNTGFYDYVCMLDMDIGYTSKNRSLENYIQSINSESKNIIAGHECVSPEHYYNGKSVNGGVYLFKNTSWTKRFLKGFLIAQTRIGYADYRLTDSLVDQMQMSYVAMICPECDEHFLITQYYDNIQMWYSHDGYDFDLEHYKSPFFHFAGDMKKSIPLYFDKLESKGEQITRDYLNFENYIIKH